MLFIIAAGAKTGKPDKQQQLAPCLRVCAYALTYRHMHSICMCVCLYTATRKTSCFQTVMQQLTSCS